MENLDTGAVENWLVKVFVESRKYTPDWEWTFYCIVKKKGKLENIVTKAGGKILYTPVSLSNKLSFLFHLRKILINGKFDIIHSHHDYLSGFYLLSTIGIKYKKRILQIHNTDKALPVKSRFVQKLLLPLFNWISLRLSNTIIGISNETLDQFVDKNRRKRGKVYSVLYYGINMDQFEQFVDSNLLREKLDIPITGYILLFTGRMNRFKNPIFAVEILGQLLNKGFNIYGIFVGEGDLKHQVITRSNELGIESFVRCLGWRDDVIEIMKVSDVFVFPRVENPKEGLGLVVVEAQAAGLLTFVSYGILREAVIINELVKFIPLDLGTERWSQEIGNYLGKKIISKQEALDIMKSSSFELQSATRNLLKFYV